MRRSPPLFSLCAMCFFLHEATRKDVSLAESCGKQSTDGTASRATINGRHHHTISASGASISYHLTTPGSRPRRRSAAPCSARSSPLRHPQFSGGFDDPIALLDTCQRNEPRGHYLEAEDSLTDRDRLATGSKSKPSLGAQRTVDTYLRSGVSRAIVS